MLKEIFEQPQHDPGNDAWPARGRRRLLEARRIEPLATTSCCRSIRSSITACGTSWHSALIGEHVHRRARAHSDRGRVRVGIPLPESDRDRQDAVHRRLTVGRDGRHAGGDARSEAPWREDARSRERRRLDDRARRRRRHLPARRSGNRRRVDQGVHEPGDRARAADAQARAPAEHVGRSRAREVAEAMLALPAQIQAILDTRAGRSKRSPNDSRTRRTSCTSAAATTSRSRSKARSSSRKSATSTPRAIRRPR